MKMKVVIPVLVVILLALLAALYFRMDALRAVLGRDPAVQEVTAVPEAAETPAPTPAPTPSPTPEPTP
ncbi:MAG: hypothetical protein IJH47_02495, partial [Oscillospiraceae bacterium]|nr:hypothetical protein [Oscillospiraceae bacterium]